MVFLSFDKLYSFSKVSNLTVPVPSTSNRRNATSYSASGFDRRFSKVAQSVRESFPVLRLSATLNRIPYCSRLILFYKGRIDDTNQPMPYSASEGG